MFSEMTIGNNARLLSFSFHHHLHSAQEEPFHLDRTFELFGTYVEFKSNEELDRLYSLAIERLSL